MTLQTDPSLRCARRSFANPPWMILAIGVALRIVIALVSNGTNDAVLWYDFGRSARTQGFVSLWSRTPLMNHPPLTVLWAAAASALSQHSFHGFTVLMKVPALAGDVLSMLLIWRVVRERTDGDEVAARLAAAFFALSPAALLITGFHCNVDPLMASLLLCSAWLADRGRLGAAGGALGAAINVKIVPAPTVFLLLAFAPDWRARRRAIAGLAIAAIPFACMAIAAGRPFLSNVVGYRPDARPWLLDWLGPLDAHVGLRSFIAAAESAHDRSTLATTFALVAALVMLIVRRRARVDVLLVTALYWSAFLLWNGGVFQYVVWPLPLLAVVRPRLALAFGIAAGAWLGGAYYGALSPAMSNLTSAFDRHHPAGGHVASVLPIACLIGIVASLVREAIRRREVNPTAYDRLPPTEPTMELIKPMKPMKSMTPMEPMEAMKPMEMPPAWWPACYGSANAAGAQNGIRYAYFGDKRRLLVDAGDGARAYDTGDHQITGIQQSQGGRSRLVFSSNDGPVSLDSLNLVALDR